MPATSPPEVAGRETSTPPLLEVRDLVKHFRLPGGWLSGQRRVLRAVDGVSFHIPRGEVFGIVGESGCGKSTLGRLLLRLLEPTAGAIRFDGTDISRLSGRRLRDIRPRMQVVFQSPQSAMDPRFRVIDAVSQPLVTHDLVPRHQRRERVLELLAQVGLGEQHLDRFPHELSGGQCQRVAVARALALAPELLVLDEPTSALDVSVQAQTLETLLDLREQHGLTYVFISHDLGVVEHVSDRVAVMYLGQIVELGSAEEVLQRPQHPYTQALLSATPSPHPHQPRERIVLEGTVPSAIDPPSGCRFHPRCPVAVPECATRPPELRTMSNGSQVACHLA
jgi:oligopeptide transport system ATP-binding protein